MKLENINITAILEEAESLLNAETRISPALAASMKLILVVMKLLIDRLGLKLLRIKKDAVSPRIFLRGLPDLYNMVIL